MADVNKSTRPAAGNRLEGEVDTKKRSPITAVTFRASAGGRVLTVAKASGEGPAALSVTGAGASRTLWNQHPCLR